jgi:hypothetical protein
MATPNPWHAALAAHCPPNVCIPLSVSDLCFLSSDETRLPAPVGALPRQDPRHALLACGDASLFSPPRPALEGALGAALLSLGPAVLPRACGVAPWDGGWASQQAGFGECLRCSSVGEVWTLLLASERVHAAAAAAVAAATAAAAGAAPAVPPTPLTPSPCILLSAWIPELRQEGEVRCELQGNRLVSAVRRRGSPALPAPLRATIEAFVASQDWVSVCGSGSSTSSSTSSSSAACVTLDLYVPLGAGGGASGCEGVLVLDMSPSQRAGTEAEEGAPTSSGLHFHPWAAHSFPAELYHYAAERVCASTVGRAGGGLEEGSAAGGLLSELARRHGEEEGLGSGQGWTRLVQALQEEAAKEPQEAEEE